jgi:hypothetical protein
LRSDSVPIAWWTALNNPHALQQSLVLAVVRLDSKAARTLEETVTTAKMALVNITLQDTSPTVLFSGIWIATPPQGEYGDAQRRYHTANSNNLCGLGGSQIPLQ